MKASYTSSTSAQDTQEPAQLSEASIQPEAAPLAGTHFISGHAQKRYSTDLTDTQWQEILPLVPPTSTRGRPRSINLRGVINAILYVVRGGCAWQSLPPDLPSRRTAYYYFRQWRLNGTWQKILDVLHQEGYEANGHQDLETEVSIRVLQSCPNFYVISAAQPDNPAFLPYTRSTARRRALPRIPRYLLDQVAARKQQLQPASVQPQSVAISTTPARPSRELTDMPIADTMVIPIRTSMVAVPHLLETIIVIVGLTVSFAAHAINVFYFPHYEEDEGTYMSNAWAITHGLITPYPYGYGHPPLAWMQIAAWTKLTGGFFTFGNAINSGRVLMLLFAVGCSLLVYLITRRLSGSLITGLLAMAIFSLSPLSITFQREVLLDNFATFWFLLSFYLVVISKSRLLYIVSAAISFGFAFLSKEIIIVLLPVMIYAVWLYTARFQRTFTLVAFTYIVIAICSCYVLLAVLKGELFPYSWHLPRDHHPHLSLLDTYIWQASRGQSEGNIIDSWNAWIKADPLLIALGIIPTAFNLIVGWWSRKHLLLSLFAISFWVILLRGGVVIAFYIIPLIPLVALNTALAINTLAHWVGQFIRLNLARVLLIFVVIAAIVPYDIQHLLNPYNLFTLRPSAVEQDALVWIRNHVSHRAVVVINSNIYVDLHEQNGEGVGDGATYPYAHVYWNVGFDPALHDKLLDGNWDRIDYIVADSVMLKDIKINGGGMEIISQALSHSVLQAAFFGDDYEFIQIYQVIHKQAGTPSAIGTALVQTRSAKQA
jgi:transposase/4-amino-4-deoxy-L-arabinose transferase-like glycosyltransferase